MDEDQDPQQREIEYANENACAIIIAVALISGMLLYALIKILFQWV